ncbi:MAG: hypothetical protein ACTS3F_14470 [Phycisphaerales bacterium]
MPDTPDHSAPDPHRSNPPPQRPAPEAPSQRPPRKSIARSLGEFVAHITHAIKTDPAAHPDRPHPNDPSRVRLAESTEQRAATDAQGRPIILRRTTIDEIEYPARGADHSDADPDRGDASRR